MTDQMWRWCGFLAASVLGWLTHAAVRQAESPFRWRCPQPKCRFMVTSTEPAKVTDAVACHSQHHTREVLRGYQ